LRFAADAADAPPAISRARIDRIADIDGAYISRRVFDRRIRRAERGAVFSGRETDSAARAV
jgi:hypothetical protein